VVLLKRLDDNFSSSANTVGLLLLNGREDAVINIIENISTYR
jgi:hypothetical protein